MRAALDDQLAGADFFRVGQQAGFDNHFDRPLVGGFDHVNDFAENKFVVAGLEPRDVQHHVNLVRAVVNGRLGFKPFSRPTPLRRTDSRPRW